MKKLLLIACLLSLLSCAKEEQARGVADAIPQDAELVVTLTADTLTAYAFLWHGYIGVATTTATADSLARLLPVGSDAFVVETDGNRSVAIGPASPQEEAEMKRSLQAWLAQAEGGTPTFSGQRLISVLRANPATRTALLAMGMVVDVEMLLRAIDGAVNITLQGDSLVALEAEVTSTDFLAEGDFQWFADNGVELSATGHSVKLTAPTSLATPYAEWIR